MTATLSPVVACEACGKTCSARRRRRGLCRSCYADPALFRTHPPTGTLARLDSSPRHRDFSGPARTPPPTHADPGSADKLSVLQGRYARRQALFSRADPTLPVHLPDPARDWDAMYLWRLFFAADPSILQELRPAAVG